MIDDLNNTAGRGDLRGKFDASARRSLIVDAQKYQSYLDDSGLSQSQKEEFLQALWSVIVSFVEIGFGVHPAQQVCGQEQLSEIEDTKAAFNGVTSDDPKSDATKETSRPRGALEVE